MPENTNNAVQSNKIWMHNKNKKLKQKLKPKKSKKKSNTNSVSNLKHDNDTSNDNEQEPLLEPNSVVVSMPDYDGRPDFLFFQNDEIEGFDNDDDDGVHAEDFDDENSDRNRYKVTAHVFEGYGLTAKFNEPAEQMEPDRLNPVQWVVGVLQLILCCLFIGWLIYCLCWHKNGRKGCCKCTKKQHYLYENNPNHYQHYDNNPNYHQRYESSNSKYSHHHRK